MEEGFTTDYKGAKEHADEILLSPFIKNTFPPECFDLVEKLASEVAIEILPFSWIEEHGMKVGDVVHSDDAETFEKDGMYIIFYNQRSQKSRRDFGIMHEIGHIYNGHDMEIFTKYRKTKAARLEKLYKKCEAEANRFAAELLMPESILRRLQELGCRIDVAFLQREFGVSAQAAKISIDSLKRSANNSVSYWEKDASLDDAILLKFNAFIERNAPRRKSYTEELECDLAMQAERDSWLADGW
ncbi:MAG: ImmA/IrrE family metallo-endopeptidase [Treponemataceae bacterium]|nr:ImmA/IrrE family metallo-endopeptidase [Treponemataceae bacterium]